MVTPFNGQTTLEYTGPKHHKHLNVGAEYSWLKSPRWKGHAMEVGPLARVLMMYAKKDAAAQDIVNRSLSILDLETSALFSTLGRTLARAVETKIVVNQLQSWYDQLLDNIAKGDTDTFNPLYFDPINWPIKGQGVGVMEAPRGALGHWLVMQNGKIENYQCVVPTTWNAGLEIPTPRQVLMKPLCKINIRYMILTNQRFCEHLCLTPCACAVRVERNRGKSVCV